MASGIVAGWVRIALACIVAGCLAALSSATPAAASSRAAALAVDMNTGRVLFASEADELRFPASLTKMMTLYIVFGEIEAGRMSYATKIRISEHASRQRPSKLDLEPGEEISAINAIKALITKSANDIAAALAEHVAGSEPAFARLMTERARQIGMPRTVFRNASGLPDPEQVTTARDMITLGQRLYDDFPKHWSLFSTRYFPYEGNTYRNHNTLLGTYEGVDGIKTGYTARSGFNVVTSAQRAGKHVMVAVFGGDTAAARNATVRNIMNRAMLQASPLKTRRAAPQLVADLRTTGAKAAPPRPAAPARTEPKLAAAPPVPQPVVRPQPAPRAAPPPPAPSPVNRPGPDDRAGIAQLVAEAASAPVIEIARVRRVAFAPPTDPAPVESQAEAPAGPAESPLSERLALGRRLAGDEATAVGRTPATLEAQARAMTTDEPPLPPQSTSPVAPAVAVPPAEVRPTMTAALAPSRPAAAIAGEFQLQVGAFGTEGEAERMLGATRSRTGDLLKPYAQAAIAVQKDNRRLFRARFVGFDAASAGTVCTELRRQKIDCFVMKAE